MGGLLGGLAPTRAGSRAGDAAWWAGLALGAGGLALLGAGAPEGHAPFSAALLLLMARAVLAYGPRRAALRRGAAAAGGVLLLAGLMAYDLSPPGDERLATVLAATGAQVLLAALALPARRGALPAGRSLLLVVSHAWVLLGSWVVLLDPLPFRGTATIAYAGGLGGLAVAAHWARRHAQEAGEGRAWEAGYLAAVMGAVLLLPLAGALLDPSGEQPSHLQQLLLRGAFLLVLALLAGPPAPPRALRAPRGSVGRFAAQGLVFVAFLNVVMFAALQELPLAAAPLYAVVLAWLCASAGFEHAAALHALRRRRSYEEPVPQVEPPPLTVVVAAKDERALLARCAAEALALPCVARLVLAVSEASRDGSVEEARALAARHPGRVVHVPGTSASKAGDLNLAWEHVGTDLAVLLDADETLDAATLPWAVAALASQPWVGIVQGRKLARRADTGVQRLALAERRYSTLCDQAMLAEAFDAAHFAGSGALLRREVPGSAGGWSDATLTEDIELTFRLYLHTPWRIAYEPRFVVHGEPPRGFPALVRQRARWARGWAQVYALHLPALLRHRAHVRPRRLAGILWQLTTAVSAPWSVFLPAFSAAWALGAAPSLPWLPALALALFLLPGRLLSYAAAHLLEPRSLPPAPPRRALAAGLEGYFWMAFGWLLQLQALYLEAMGASAVWHATRAARPPVPPGAPAPGAAPGAHAGRELNGP